MNKPYNPNSLTIEELLENKIYQIPVYQRPYSWEKEQVVDLLNDIYETYLNKESLFLGTIYAKNLGAEKGQIYRYELIDGQQRITTISFILISIYVNLMMDPEQNQDTQEYRKI